MERLAAKLSECLYQEKIIEKDVQEVYQYCIEVTLSTIGYWVSIFICAILLGRFKESIIYLGAFMAIRFCFGGYHAGTHLRCALVSMSTYGIFIWFISQFPSSYYLHFIIISWGLIVIIGAIFAPTDHENKPFIGKEYQKYRRYSLAVIILMSVIIGIGLATGKQTLLVCLNFGALQAAISLLIAIGQKKLRYKMD